MVWGNADVMSIVCAHLDFASMQSLESTCKDMRSSMDDRHYAMVAILQWGSAFWNRALSRSTQRAFIGMRDELRRIAILDLHCIRCGSPKWGLKEFEAFWAYEAVLPSIRYS